MIMRLGFGPVFVLESLINARRRQVYALRSLFALALLTGMTIVWVCMDSWSWRAGGIPTTFQQMARIGEWFFYALAGIQISLIMLAAPAATAGAIGMDRARGTLLQMMATDLSDAEIVLGTLAARLAPVFGMAACGVPVMAVASLLGGVEFGALLGAFAVTLALAVLGSVVAMTLAVRVSKTHEVLMAVYLLECFGLLSLPFWWSFSSSTSFIKAPPDWFQKLNPYVLVYSPYTRPGFVDAWDFAVFVGLSLILSAALVGFTIATLRRVVVEQSGRPERASRRWSPDLKRLFPSWPSPTLDGDPVLWREWHRNRPSRLGRRLWAGLLGLCWGLAAWGIANIVLLGTPEAMETLDLGFVLVTVFGFLILSVTAPTVLAEERMRGSLDVLIATPLSTRSIVAAKWWGAYRRVFALAWLPLFAGIFLAASRLDPALVSALPPGGPSPVLLSGWDRLFAASFCIIDFLASGALIVSIGVALATWIRPVGRAITISVVGYLLAGLVWPMAVELVGARLINLRLISGPAFGRTSPYQVVQHSLISLSPILGTNAPIQILTGYLWWRRDWFWVGILIVVLVKLLGARALFHLTVKTFDRCLGRIPEARPSRRPGRPKKPVLEDELVPTTS